MDAACPGEKPKDSFSKPKCMLVPVPLGDTSHPDMQRRFCGLECSGDSYCPSGSKCSLIDVSSEIDQYGEVNPLARNYPHLIGDDHLKGVPEMQLAPAFFLNVKRFPGVVWTCLKAKSTASGQMAGHGRSIT
ncbi:unnamed protein product [Effrenium voratum]|nr:unnamed protein product [Effrenium voratum]